MSTGRAYIGLYAGSFDPVTLGHEDIVRRALHFLDRVVVAVAANGTKSPLFSAAERATLFAEAVRDDRVEVREFGGLLVDLAREVGAVALVRGVRNVTDYDYEVQMARMNRQLAPDIETLFLAPSADVAHISSTFVRDVARHGGPLDALVRPNVAAALRARFAG
ncbi:MAG: pantetheine-phosphate adenylyltransferase [Gemmatirosa sp.]|nr:pantetheine-phosphate adenylyltransferase [Gemmatirosa sp.]